jgi:hypothetical protein
VENLFDAASSDEEEEEEKPKAKVSLDTDYIPV